METHTDLDFIRYFSLSSDHKLLDGQARLQALNPQASYIVQAPAGSGKTALLAMRFLALLSTVESPEQIVAMTFTKKAAAEMRERVLRLLRTGEGDFPHDGNLMAQNAYRLAQKALERDQELGWNLLQNPNRLRIRTIDGLNSYLVGQMPLLSKMGAQMQIHPQPQQAYQEAVRMALQDKEVEPAVKTLLQLMNGRFGRAEALLMSMLQKRDQWMSVLLNLQGEAVRLELEVSLQELVTRELNAALSKLGNGWPEFEQICQIAEFARAHQREDLSVLCGAWPLGHQAEDAVAWRSLADWILTADGGLRKPRGINKNHGFPAGDKEAKRQKEALADCLQGLADKDRDGQMLEALNRLRALPESSYSEQQWQSLEQFIQLLHYCVAYLKVVLQQQGQADFIEVAQAASRALGSEDAPTDLAQQLDYQIRHLLVDEFQDTSVQQFHLLHKLIAGWQQGEDKSLFLVGDPMQSIYRFREAEVGNFLKAWQGAIGDWVLTPLELKVNFRSSQAVVKWVNHSFARLLPSEDKIEQGAVSYRSSDVSPFNDQGDEHAVRMHLSFNQAPQQEAQAVLALIEQRIAQWGGEAQGKSIALLGRTRSSLVGIAYALKQAGIQFRAVELEALSERQEVQDIQALTQALLHLGDRAAWIALLRSPLVGLSLSSMQTIVGEEFAQTLWQQLQAFDSQSLPEFEAARLNHFLVVMTSAQSRLGTLPLSRVVYECWLQLEGALTLEDETALDNVQMYLQLLSELGETEVTWVEIEQMMASLFARANSSEQSAQIELMTMHKSKGLEFDTVILPGLGRRPRGDEASLIDWYQYVDARGEERLLLAPIDQRGRGDSKLRQLFQAFEKQKQNYELARLLYVACTRAKQQLHLFANINVRAQAQALPPPVKGSMLEVLWPVAEAQFEALPLPEQGYQAQLASMPEIQVSRLLKAPDSYVSLLLHEQKHSTLPKQKGFARAALTTMHDDEHRQFMQQSSPSERKLNIAVGNAVHEVLQVWVGMAHGQRQAMLHSSATFAYLLQREGLSGSLMQHALQRVHHCLACALDNSAMQWLLSHDFVEHQSEWALSSVDGKGNVAQHIIDRSVVDAQGVRWIVDYKTSHCHDEAELEAFIAHHVLQYTPQLQRYSDLLQVLESRPQRRVLYFASHDIWYEVS